MAGTTRNQQAGRGGMHAPLMHTTNGIHYGARKQLQTTTIESHGKNFHACRNWGSTKHMARDPAARHTICLRAVRSTGRTCRPSSTM